MIATKLELEGLLLFQLRQFVDNRGMFFESFNNKDYALHLGKDVEFVQDNVSYSKKNVIRGLHFQSPPFAQGKLVSVLKGSVLDVAVDIRRKSLTYGKYIAVELNATNGLQLFIPPGFAHGFLSLEDETVFSYKCTNYYSPGHEDTLLWNDPNLAIEWPVKSPIISQKDAIGKEFINFESPF
jgi:dTDP-4-dehydrorhamnose 3,5-epimerase